MSNKNILLINDLPGYGKVALSAMIPIFSYYGIESFNLPTALVSNTLDYGKFVISDTTQYMRDTIEVWKQLDFRFDSISTGFIVSVEQAMLVHDFIADERAKNPDLFVISDPIMADNGKVYNGLGDDTIKAMRKLISQADLTIPNHTEALLLLKGEYDISLSPADIISGLKQYTKKSIVMTSYFDSTTNSHMVIVYDHKKDSIYYLPYKHIDAHFPGTGDIFASILSARVLNGGTLKESAAQTMEDLVSLIQKSHQNTDSFKGIAVEKYLRELDLSI